MNSIDPLYIIINKLNRCKYLTLVPTNESKEIWSKIRDLIKSVTKNSDGYDEKYMKTKFNLDYKLPLNQTIESPCMIIVVRAVFHENNKYYSQVFFDKCEYKL